MTSYLYFAALVGFASFDVWWYVRYYAVVLWRMLFHGVAADVSDDFVMYSVCSGTDLDVNFHMNNGRYLRELDFARVDYFCRSGFIDYIREKAPGSHVVQHASTIRYRKSITFLMPFKVVTRLVYFDQRSVYFEQHFVSLSDGFVRAVAICKNTASGGLDFKKLMRDFGQPEMKCLPDVKQFIECHEVSSNKLKVSPRI